MRFEDTDYPRLAMEIRRFLSKADIITRLSAMPVLYLELPDVGTMHALHVEIIRSMQSMLISCGGQQWSFPDDHTIKFEPMAGVTIVLSCKQRFEVMTGGSVAYRDIAFQDVTTQKDKG